ncbi:hypothetical protein FA95DRAFT_484486 [Auriscalpium vulgare]|uniref:Uncharacterized protein n=1 Tax=Auriscalpium vulgare TaxID=40419 RepID=A0ACB8SC83_9AGAM|nr:hypothetical protein FA95DRAFT_484486 [Auriscalpium vulgare]
MCFARLLPPLCAQTPPRQYCSAKKSVDCVRIMSKYMTKRAADTSEPEERLVTKKSRVDGGSDSVLPPFLSSELLASLEFSPSDCASASLIQDRFNLLAEQLLHRYRIVCTAGSEVADGAGSSSSELKAQHTEYDILEVEFYLFKKGCHEDLFTHGSEEQRTAGLWYFHRVPRKVPTPVSTIGGYKGGTRKGLDLTIGNSKPHPTLTTSPYFNSLPSQPPLPQHPIHGGILLRTLRRISDSRVISGPSLLVDEVLRASRAGSITELVQVMWAADIFALPAHPSSGKTASLYLTTKPPGGKSPTIYTSPRIGLDLSNPSTRCSASDPRVQFVAKPYRYFVEPCLLTANGRGQTFFGVFQACRRSVDLPKERMKLITRVAELTSIKLQTVAKYLVEYEVACLTGNLRAFVGAAGKGASASPATFLRMMGSLERFQGGA